MGVRVIIVDEDRRDRFTCPICSQVFDTPHQAECGDRYCEACLSKLTATATTDNIIKCLCCNEALTTPASFKDSACQRELNALLVKCGWTGCDWQGKFIEFKEHELNCKFVLLKCAQCEEMVTRQGLDDHTTIHQQQRAGAVDERDGGGQRMIDNNGIMAIDHSMSADRLFKCEEEVQKLRQMLEELQTNYSDLMLIVQSLQATSYNGKYIWKIPEVTRRWKEAQEGKTLSLYSAPFYTSRHGYRMCLRLYLNGDGTGKGSHISYFLTIMRGEFDALLQWPFQQVVRLALRSQNPSSKSDIRHCFKPDAYSSSFMRPRSDMNIASGCPKFAPVSVLSDEDFVQEDTMFLQCNIDLTGLEEIN